MQAADSPKGKDLADSTQIRSVYDSLTSRYYDLGNIDSLKYVTYQYMDWCLKHNEPEIRYRLWRQYIQRMTEKGMQEEAIAETALLHSDAEKSQNKYGLACGEMCIGYNHRVFSNNVKLCIDYYNNALKLFEESKYYRDMYVVLLNIVQTYLSRNEYAEGRKYLNRLEQLEEKLDKQQVKIEAELHLRFCEFRVIILLASQGKAAALPYIEETDRFYRQHSDSSTPEAWFAYKIMCSRILGDLKSNLAYVDSLMAYQHSLGIRYPYNYIMKAELQVQLGDYRAACNSYSEYVQVNDSVRQSEQDELLSKYTAQFEVDRLKMEKLELNAKLNKDRLTMVLIAGGIVLALLLVITYLYVRSLSMNRSLEAARQAVQKLSRVKSSFIQHITHEIRTPLNSIVGFSTLLAEGGVDEEEKADYAAQVESNNAYLLTLMENILTIADMDSQVSGIPKELTDVNACCEECIDKLQSAVKPGVALEHLPSPELPALYAARSWLKIVLLALLDNAVKFTEKGYIRISCKEDKPRGILRFVIEDTGIGIEAADAGHIFERFYKADTFTKGSGLGLAIAGEIMDIVGGRIYLDETYKNGSRFIMEWPLQERS